MSVVKDVVVDLNSEGECDVVVLRSELSINDAFLCVLVGSSLAIPACPFIQKDSCGRRGRTTKHVPYSMYSIRSKRRSKVLFLADNWNKNIFDAKRGSKRGWLCSHDQTRIFQTYTKRHYT